jgi:hypothetical protein
LAESTFGFFVRVWRHFDRDAPGDRICARLVEMFGTRAQLNRASAMITFVFREFACCADTDKVLLRNKLMQSYAVTFQFPLVTAYVAKIRMAHVWPLILEGRVVGREEEEQLYRSLIFYKAARKNRIDCVESGRESVIFLTR